MNTKKTCSEGKENACLDFSCDKHAGQPAELLNPVCERCEGTGIVKIVHLDADGNVTGQHEMYCPDGCSMFTQE